MKRTAQTTPECEHGEHQWCRGPQVIRRRGAPDWEAPVMTVHCDCTCHTPASTPETPATGQASAPPATG